MHLLIVTVSLLTVSSFYVRRVMFYTTSPPTQITVGEVLTPDINKANMDGTGARSIVSIDA